MNFNDLLRVQGIDPKKVLIMRHRPKEVRFQRILPLLAAEHHELYNAYQQTQGAREEKMLQRAEFLASFIGQESGKALFVGLYRRGQTTPMTLDEYRRHPPYKTLSEYSNQGWSGDDKRDRILWFDLLRTEFYTEWAGRLVINWTGGERSWARWSDRNEFSIDHIKEESVFDSDMPDWDELVISWDELNVLPLKWRSALSHWRGIYFILDTSDGRGYVGSAYGDQNILGRWLNYKATGHGGNKELRKREPKNFQFSILQRVSPDMEPSDIVQLESKWKDRLHTRKFGMNEN